MSMREIFKNARFITAQENASVLAFKQIFTAKKEEKAILYACGLGIAYYYINGKKITEDVFIAPVSDYSKTLWVNKFDVTEYIEDGENVFVAELGNGFYNEGAENVWNFHKAHWKGEKQLLAALSIDGKTVLETDKNWYCTQNAFYLYNDLRIGESVDFRLLDKDLYSDRKVDGWQRVAETDHLGKAKLRLCTCTPVREIEELSPCKIYSVNNKKIVDFGRNISGYVRFGYKGRQGQTIQMLYAEDFDGQDLIWHNMQTFYKSAQHIQSSVLRLSGERDTYTSKFAYYGFRYVAIEGGVTDDFSICAIVVHNTAQRNTSFCCSQPILTKLYDAAVQSTYSNMFYTMTDCPTREKLSWTNDFACSIEQLLLNFDSKSLLEKCAVDIVDSQAADGLLGGIAPTNGWGYDYACGMTGSLLFEIAYYSHEFYGNDYFIRKYLPHMLRFYRCYYEKAMQEASAFYLADWLGYKNASTDKKYIELCYALYFQERLRYFYRVADKTCAEDLDKEQAAVYERLHGYIRADGCVENDFTSLVLALRFHIGNFDVTLQKLKDNLIASDYNLTCGLVGFRFFVDFAEKNEQSDLLLRCLQAANGKFVKMVEKGDTLWEHDCIAGDRMVSLNHHMLSSFSSVFIQNVLGLKPKNGKLVFAPEKHISIEKASGSFGRGNGKVSVVVYRGDGIKAELTVGKNNYVVFRGKFLEKGVHIITIE